MLESFFTGTIETDQLLDTEEMERLALILTEVPEQCKYRITLNQEKWILARKRRQIVIERDSWYKYKSCFPVLKFTEEKGKISPVSRVSLSFSCKCVMFMSLSGLFGALTVPLVLAFHHDIHPGDLVGWLIVGTMFIFAFPVSHYLMYRSERKRLLNSVQDFISSLYLIKDGRPWPPGEKQDWVSHRIRQENG